MKTTALLLTACLAAPLAAQTSFLEQGRAALNRGDAESAANLLEKAVAQNPNSSEAHFFLGNAYGTLAQKASLFSAPSLVSKTHAEFDRALQLDPNNLDARRGLVEFFMTVPPFLGGDPEKAIEQANEIRKRDPLTGHRTFAYIYGQQKKPDLARKEYLDAVKEEPNSPKSHYWLGIGHLQIDKNYKAAADEFETSMKLDPTFMAGWFQIGHMAALSGTNLQRGEEALQKYLTYTPSFDEPPLYRAHYWLGAIYEKEGRKAEARQSYSMSLRLKPTQKDVQEALKRVS